MDRNRKWVPGFGAVLLTLLSHMTSALEVPLDLPQPPTITLQSPKDYIFDPRENIVIHCEAKGKPHPSFSWTRNGTHFDEEKDPKVLMKPSSGTLVIDISGEKAEAYEGTYQCTAHNEHGTAVSNSIETNEAIVVQMGVSLVLQCRPPAGLPPPVIFWMDNNFQRLQLDKRVSQALNGDLYFSNVLPEDTRSDYICYARFPHTQTIQQKQPISVTVLDNSPEGERRPGFMTPFGATSTKMVLRGETLELECIADGLPTPEMSWQKDGGELPSTRTSFYNFKRTLKVSEVNEAGGDYRCTATNNLGTAYHIIKVTVKGKQLTWNLILAPNETGILTCRVNGEPKPKISWFVNGVPIENAPEDHSRKVDDDTVILSNVQSGSSAVYQCNASNDFGYLMANAFVNVLAEPPRVLTPPNRVYQVITNNPAFKDSQTSVKNGDPYVIHENGTLDIHVAQSLNSGKYTCIATNILGIKENHVFLEVKEPTRILMQPEYKVVQRGMSAVFECKVDVDSLTITDVEDQDGGTYTCIMNTTLDQDSANATPTPAIVYESPDPPTDLELTDQTARSYEDLLHQPGVWINLTDASGTSTTVQLKLSPYVYYSFRVLGVNRVGYSQPSQPSSQYRTTPAAPDDNPSDVSGVGTQPGNLVISWTPLTGFQANGPNLEYRVQWRAKDVDEDWTSKNLVNVSQFVVTGTPIYVPYEVKVQAFNDYGTAPEPEAVFGYSGEDLPLSAPDSVQVMVHNSTLAEVHWEPVSSPSVRGKLQGYKVYYRRERGFHDTEEAAEQREQVLTFSGNRSEGRLPGLQPYSLYNLTIRVLNSKGEGPPSPSKNFETLKEVLDSLTLEWGPPMNNNGRLAGYTLKYQPVNTTKELGPVKSMSFPANETSITLGYLNSSMLYKFYLSAKTIKGSGPIITEEAFTVMDTTRTQPTVETGKAPPVGPAFGNVNTSMSEDGAVISWDYFGHHKNVYVEYIVENSKAFALYLKTRVNARLNATIKIILLLPLESDSSPSASPTSGKDDWKKELPGTSYKVRVVARDPSDPTVHSTDEVLVAVPAVPSRQVDIATQGWFIGLMCAIALLILVLLIVCSSRGTRVANIQKEDAHQDPEIQPMKEDDGTFGEYSDTEDHKPLKGSRTPSNGTVRRDESDDSLVDYGEGGDGQFNEDGSFIGQYSGKKEKDTHEGNESSEAPSPVNAMNSFV
ncbi:hypothetical protein F7725_021966 [Dissostichus mawsoni]|uniref:Neuronal cell adhesion molecule n=1 Tax=Dissostichus mawsoni TaxID=36200 RepID=A0A7J5ZG04_DISMA|nr:hypothetical protein F7725_021966 [Dissostichus mawsoni]